MDWQKQAEEWADSNNNTLGSCVQLGAVAGAMAAAVLAVIVHLMMFMRKSYPGEPGTSFFTVFLWCYGICFVGALIWAIGIRSDQVNQHANELAQAHAEKLAQERKNLEFQVQVEARRRAEAQDMEAGRRELQRQIDAMAEEAAREHARQETAHAERNALAAWADYQAKADFLGDVPIDVLRRSFMAEMVKRISADDMAALRRTQNPELRQILGSAQAIRG